MAENLSAEQVRNRHVKALPAEIGALFHALHNSLTTTYLSWIIFKDLFAKSPERVALLNRAAGTLFLVIQETLRRDVMLAIARMTDTSVTGGGQENATISTLINDLQPHIDQMVGKELAQKADDLVTLCKSIRTHRNKTLAHSDKPIAIASKDAMGLPGVTMATVDTALEATAGIMNDVSRLFDLGTTFYDDVIHAGGAGSLVVDLHSAEVFHHACQQSKKEPGRAAEILREACQQSRKGID